MKRCPITYEEISDQQNYSERGLRLLSPQLKDLAPLEYSAAEQRREALARAGKMSIQGIQTKLSAQLKIKESRLQIVDQAGHYILKPQSEYYTELPENEAITMTLATTIGLEVPVHGLVYSKDGSMTYFIKRFDRAGHNKKLALEDFAQLSQASRDTKYQSSMEKIAEIISNNQIPVTYPIIEAVKLLKLTLFNFLIGNEDMHLKNFSLITRDQKIQLSPCYDLLNSTISQANTKEELALPLNGKKTNLRKKDFLEYFAKQRLNLNDNVIATVISEIKNALPNWKSMIEKSFLSKEMQEKYLKLLAERSQRLEV